MGKGIDAYKLILYVFACVIGIAVISIVLLDINTKVHTALNNTAEPEKFPAPQTVESDIVIENMRAFAGSDEVTQGKSSALLIRDLGTIPVKIEFDASMPKTADYPKEGASIIFRFDSEVEKKDFDSCSVVKNVAPGTSVHVSSDDIAGCITVKSDWSGWVTVRISAKTMVNGDEQGLATSYENFRVFRRLSTMKSGSLCQIASGVEIGENIYLYNDAGDVVLGKKLLQESNVLYNRITETGKIGYVEIRVDSPTILTTNGDECYVEVDGVKKYMLMFSGSHPYKSSDTILYAPFQSFETSPSFTNEMTVKKNSDVIISIDRILRSGYSDIPVVILKII